MDSYHSYCNLLLIFIVLPSTPCEQLRLHTEIRLIAEQVVSQTLETFRSYSGARITYCNYKFDHPLHSSAIQWYRFFDFQFRCSMNYQFMYCNSIIDHNVSCLAWTLTSAAGNVSRNNPNVQFIRSTKISWVTRLLMVHYPSLLLLYSV